jgi:hypothetical protein
MQQHHLAANQQQDLAQILQKFPKLFRGILGCYLNRKVHLELRKDATPSRCRPYPVPKHHEKVFKEELNQLCSIGVLLRCGALAWLLPSFIIPKKDSCVQWISNFQELNKYIERKVHNLPKIGDILNCQSGYKYFTKLDIFMQYYTFELDEYSKQTVW